MISEGDHWLIRHRKGGYLVARYATNLSAKRPPYGLPPLGATVYALAKSSIDATVLDRAGIDQLLTDAGWGTDQLVIARAPVCACCGSPEIVRHPNRFLSPYRCEKHRDRNPCAIDGCKRTGAASGNDQDGYRLSNIDRLCGEHWRRYVPARSHMRRAYHGHFARAKRNRSKENPDGWTQELAARYWRFWRRLIRLVRKRASEGFLDEAAINRAMGWD